jgi:hypothetical protein
LSIQPLVQEAKSSSQGPQSFSIEGFVVSIKPPTEHRLFTTLSTTHLTDAERVKFRTEFDDAKRPIDELWKLHSLRGTSFHETYTRMDKRSWAAVTRPSLFPSRFSNALKVLRGQILDFLNDASNCVALEEAPSEEGNYQVQRKIFIVPFAHLHELNARRREWDESVVKLNAQIRDYLAGKGPDGKPIPPDPRDPTQPGNLSYAYLVKIVEMYGVKFLTKKPEPTDEDFLPPIQYRFSAHTISSSPGLIKKAVDLQPPDARADVENMLKRSDNLLLGSMLSKFYHETLASVKNVVDTWEGYKTSGKALGEREEARAKKASVKKLSNLKNIAEELGLKSLTAAIASTLKYVEETKPGDVKVAVIEREIKGRVKGLL